MGEGHQLRWGGIAGIAAVVLAIVARLVVGSVPGTTSTPRTIALFLVEHRTQILVAALIYGAALVFVLWFGAALSTAFRRADDTSDAPAIVLAGFAMICAIGVGAVSVLAGITYALTEVPFLLIIAPGPYMALPVVSAIAGTAVALPLGAAAVAISRTHVFPVWVAWFAGVVALLHVLAGIGVVSGLGAFAPGTALVSYVPMILTGLWVLTASGLLVREHLPSISAEPTTAAPPAVGHA
jgi:hypothetical protein